MSTSYAFNPTAWDFKPKQAGQPAVQVNAKVKASTGDVPRSPTTTPQKNLAKISFEEQRLQDYNLGKLGAVSNVAFPTRVASVDKKKLELLRGSGIEIHVGTSASPSDQWSLPINLISHYSPYLKAACTSNDEEPIKQINIPERDPAEFGFFVEWMYYGSYHATLASDPHIHAKCWILGDKLESPKFKNYVMRLLYSQHTTSPFNGNVTCEEVQYVCDNTPSSAKLRQYYENLVVQHYSNPGKLQGSTEDWDALLQKYSGMRIALLQNMRHPFAGGKPLKDVSDYLEPTEAPLKPFLKSIEDSTISVKEQEDSIISVKEQTDKEVQPDVDSKAQEVSSWKFEPKLNETSHKLPIRENAEKDKEPETSVNGKSQDEVRQGASSLNHWPKFGTGSPSTIKGSGQEDTDETLVSADPKKKRRKYRKYKGKRQFADETPEPSIDNDKHTDDSSSETETEQAEPEPAEAQQVRTEQGEAQATPEPDEDEIGSTDSEPDAFADRVQANRERQDAVLRDM
ncbi:hypothetical protein ACHAQD_002469 [Fusarium lateritium]